MSLNERVLSRLSLLSPKLQRAALYVVEHPEEVATRSLRQVARANEMSAPTFSRLAHVLEFDSFDELRVANDRLLLRGLERLVAEPARQDTPGLQRLRLYPLYRAQSRGGCYGGRGRPTVIGTARHSAGQRVLESASGLC